MRTICLFLASLLALSASAIKRVKTAQLYYGDKHEYSVSFIYDEYGRLSEAYRKGMSGERDGKIIVTYSPDGATITIEEVLDPAIEDLVKSVSYVEDGLIKEYDCTFGEGEEYFKRIATYNENREGVYYEEQYANGTFMSYHLTWQDGNIVAVTVEGVGTVIEFTPSSYDNPASNPYFMELIDAVTDFDMPNSAYYLKNYNGRSSSKLPQSRRNLFNEEESQYSYLFDAEGNITEVTELLTDNHGGKPYVYRATFEYEEGTSINSIAADTLKRATSFYDLCGRRVSSQVKGVAISKDGTKKIVR